MGMPMYALKWDPKKGHLNEEIDDMNSQGSLFASSCI